ncbi:sensor histidine kinase [Plantibacter sp. Mn2098]|uniref:sensor histidine kinase n=1 Tax=Plantibacter sp. Mn2098 TaxID=3395266 RepID=UPI003BD62272
MAFLTRVRGFLTRNRAHLVTVVCALISLIGVVGQLRIQWVGAHQAVPIWVGLSVLAAFVVIHLFRERQPEMMLIAGFALAIVEGFATGSSSLAALIFLGDLFYAAALYSPSRWIDVAGVAFAVIGVAMSILFSVRWNGAFGVALATMPLLYGTFVWWGRAVRAPRLEAERERTRADAIERAADALRYDAVLQERLGISRELHDVIAGHLSAIAMQSSASLERAPVDGERMRRSMEAIRQSSIDALADMRVMIDVLRTERSAPGSLHDLDRTVAVARANGLTVRLDVPEQGSLSELSAESSLVAYRVLSESLTNVAKHAPGATVDVAIHIDRTMLRVTVANPVAQTRRNRPTGFSGGVGLIGLAERARLAGGALRAGLDDGRWVVHADIPLTHDRAEAAA